MNSRVCDQCQQPIAVDEGLQLQESTFVREAKENAHADASTTTYDLHDACAPVFAGDRRKPLLDRFAAGKKTVAAAGVPKTAEGEA